MKQHISPIINVTDLVELYKLESTVLIDASNGINAQLNYEVKHLDTALFVNLNTQLSDIKDNVANGGRHPAFSWEVAAAILP